ncbi:MAG: lipid-binding SYLF domain-containing protein [Rhizobiales bacterium]|nr:lipid-binding SYLF domain-containing protein [Hyphomicrobiales bacterium]
MLKTRISGLAARAALMGVLLNFAAVGIAPESFAADTEKSETDNQSDTNLEAASLNAGALVQDAEATLIDMMDRPRFAKVMKRAKGLIIFPSLLKAGYFVGGKSGSGVLVLKNEDGTWSYPAFYQITGGSFGLQIGVSVSQVAIVLMSDQAVDAAINGNLKLGGELGVAIGPAAVDAGIDTNYDMLTFTISNGLFAGVALDGSTITKTPKRNHAFYGPEVKTREILIAQTVMNPKANSLLTRLGAASSPSN